MESAQALSELDFGGERWSSRPQPAKPPRPLDSLDLLESEAVYILREVAGECANPALLFSGGKDSVVLLRLAEKAFRPGPLPFPLLHIDTGHNFPEVIAFRDACARELGQQLIVREVAETIRQGKVVVKTSSQSRNAFQSVTLLDTIAEFGFDALIGGARRDEEKLGRRNASFPSATNSANGIRAASARSYGICTTRGFRPGST
jgi:sulfate adenylyltransferase subunit 2